MTTKKKKDNKKRKRMTPIPMHPNLTLKIQKTNKKKKKKRKARKAVMMKMIQTMKIMANPSRRPAVAVPRSDPRPSRNPTRAAKFKSLPNHPRSAKQTPLALVLVTSVHAKPNIKSVIVLVLTTVQNPSGPHSRLLHPKSSPQVNYKTPLPHLFLPSSISFPQNSTLIPIRIPKRQHLSPRKKRSITSHTHPQSTHPPCTTSPKPLSKPTIQTLTRLKSNSSTSCFVPLVVPKRVI